MKVKHRHKWKREKAGILSALFTLENWRCACGARVVDHGLYGWYTSKRVKDGRRILTPVGLLARGMQELLARTAPGLKRTGPAVSKILSSVLLSKLGAPQKATTQLMSEGALDLVEAFQPELLRAKVRAQKKSRKVARRSHRAKR
jgi:hypothetical protein